MAGTGRALELADPARVPRTDAAHVRQGLSSLISQVNFEQVARSVTGAPGRRGAAYLPEYLAGCQPPWASDHKEP